MSAQRRLTSFPSPARTRTHRRCSLQPVPQMPPLFRLPGPLIPRTLIATGFAGLGVHTVGGPPWSACMHYH